MQGIQHHVVAFGPVCSSGVCFLLVGSSVLGCVAIGSVTAVESAAAVNSGEMGSWVVVGMTSALGCSEGRPREVLFAPAGVAPVQESSLGICFPGRGY